MDETDLQTYWDAFAPEYAAIQAESQLPLASRVEQVLKKRHLLPTATVLDLGTGAGRFLPVLAANAQQVVALDISQEMLKFARQAEQTHGFDNITFVQANWQTFISRVGKYDIIFASMFPDVTDAKEMEQLLQLAVNGVIFGHFIRRQSQLDTIISRSVTLQSPDDTFNDAVMQSRKNALADLGQTYSVDHLIFKTFEPVDRHLLLMDLKDQVINAEVPELLEAVARLYHKKQTLKDEICYVYELLMVTPS
ncbi:class I SAM-dependent methyltransferase [Agrilactobacillus fermenti]|uniref:class I SAM-dependent methyltransferase n=1 Tax=Agrilactobacillus fermenti TaxID=2586909 RepID=UPI001E30B683|nr:class I SAM-dependent methyltransferase [Agrilactobacillus fermenti]MCD2256319.1 class I SAM-dependent methyltransferase [Agrilactobacillus fermenti]